MIFKVILRASDRNEQNFKAKTQWYDCLWQLRSYSLTSLYWHPLTPYYGQFSLYPTLTFARNSNRFIRTLLMASSVSLLRCFERIRFFGDYTDIFQSPWNWICPAPSDHYKLFTSDWLWIGICQNAVFSKIGDDYDSKKQKTLKSIKSEFCAILRLASENPTPGTYSVVFSKYPPWEAKNSVCLNSNKMNISETAPQNSFYTSSHNLHDVYNNVLWIMSETFIKIDLLL